MMLLLKYTGEIRLNQVGINFDFPHYSSILGAILAAYHKFNQTPKYPRIDMYEMAKNLDIELSLLSKNDNTLLLEYVQYRNMEKKIKDGDNPSSPGNRHIMKGEYYILIKSSNDNLLRALLTIPIKIGSNDGAIIDYSIEVIADLESFKNKYNGLLYYLKNNKNYLFETNYRQSGLEVCLVSQIKKFETQKIFAQGIYSMCEWEELSSYYDFELISYKNLHSELDQEIIEYINKINQSVDEVLE